jgi:hypothetical protein
LTLGTSDEEVQQMTNPSASQPAQRPALQAGATLTAGTGQDAAPEDRLPDGQQGEQQGEVAEHDGMPILPGARTAPMPVLPGKKTVPMPNPGQPKSAE